jgi:ribosome recycling factor
MATTEKPVLSKYKDRMDKAVAALLEEFGSLRTGRASASLLDQIRVDAYGSSTPLNQVGAISVPEPRMINISVWDRALVVSVEKAIRASDLGLNPVVDGTTLRLPIPPLTEERRKDLAKLAGKYAEQQRVAVRNIRRDANEGLKKLLKDKAISEDDERRAQDDVQKLTDRFVSEIDRLVAEKEKEVLTV